MSEMDDIELDDVANKKMSNSSSSKEADLLRNFSVGSRSKEPIQKSKLGSLLSFHSINYEVTVKKKKKIILSDVK